MISENNKRIAKNTLMLYVRMFVVMGVSLFTTRITFKILGVEDYGINNIVSGVIVLFTFMDMVLNAATQRFLSFEIGRKNEERTNAIFSTSMTIYLVFVLLVIILGETIGLYVFYKLNIPQDRITAAFWVYQFSILTFSINIIRIPFNATIMAYEKMNFYAYLGIIEAILKLAFVFLLFILPFDKLILLAGLNTLTALTILLAFKTYSNKNFPITKFRLIRDKAEFKPLLSFSGWSLFGSISNISAQQGVSILLNMFLGVTVNAAVGIANQIASSVNSFVSNFQVAFRPQITKLYSSGDISGFYALIFRASKFSYYLFLILAVPIIVTTPFLIHLWLGEVPEYAVIFTRLIIIYLMIDALSAPLWMAIEAVGVIKKYHLYTSVLIVLNLPLAFVVLKYGYAVYYVWIIKILIALSVLLFLLLYTKKQFGFPLWKFLLKVLVPVACITLLSFPVPIYFNQFYEQWTGFLVSCVVAVIMTTLLIILIGLDKTEQGLLTHVIKGKIKRIH